MSTSDNQGNKKQLRLELDEILDQLLLVVAQQLLEQARQGDNLKSAIDFLKLHRRSVSEDMVLGATTDPNDYLNSLIEDLAPKGHIRNRQ
jgi:hypothetical protein